MRDPAAFPYGVAIDMLLDDPRTRYATVARLIASRTVWAVTFSNYEPAEIDSLWATKQEAEQRAAALGGEWHPVEWELGAMP